MAKSIEIESGLKKRKERESHRYKGAYTHIIYAINVCMSCVERMRTFLDNVDLPHYAEKKARVKGSHTNMSFILIR